MTKTHKSYNHTNLSNQKFTRLTPIEPVEGHYSLWRCRCDCGNEKIVYASRLISGKTKSCGCLEKENIQKFGRMTVKHGMTETILYKKWCGIKARCYNPHYKYYDRYGGRGIKMCEEWQGEHGFENFAKWAYENGYDDSKVGYEQSIDRKDVDGDYEPSNCKWSDQLEQVRNRSNTRVIIDVDGEEMTSDQFSLKHNITADMFVYRRVRKGISAQEILDEWNHYVKCTNGDYFTVKEALEYYGVSDTTLKKWLKLGLLKYEMVRCTYYIQKGQNKPHYEKKYATKHSE